MKSFTSSGSFDAFISVLPTSNDSIKEERISQRSANIRGMSNNTVTNAFRGINEE